MRVEAFVAIVLGGCVLAASPSVAWAAPDESARAEAARLFKQGSAEYAGNHYAQAAADFESSNRLVPRAAAIYSAARAWDAAGDLARAADDYDEALERTDLHGADADDARRRLGQIERRVGVVVVHTPDDARTWIGPLQGVLGSVRVHLRAGDYDARVERAGSLPWTASVLVDDGRLAELTADLRPAPAAHAAALAPATAPPSERSAPRSSAKRTWTWIAFGTAAAGAVASSILYAESISARDAFTATGARDAHLRGIATSWRTGTYVAYAVTGAALAAGVSIVLVW